MASVKLRNLQSEDRAFVMGMLMDTNVMQFLGPRRALSSDEAASWFHSELDRPSRFVIADLATDEFIGFCGLKKMDGVQDFGYFLRSEYWGRGIATKACELALERLKVEVDLRDLHIFIADENVASRRVAEKLGWRETTKAQKDGENGRYYLAATP